MANKIVENLGKEEVEMDMTPMIDVTFLLLIFFMCTLNFKTLEGMLPSYLPKESGVFSLPPQTNPAEPIYIQLINDKEKGTIIYIGDTKLEGENKYDEVYNKVYNYIKNTGEGEVIIAPDLDVPFQDVISTLNACKKVQNTEEGKKLRIKFRAEKIPEGE